MEQIIIENGGTTGIANYSAVVSAVQERLKVYEGLIVTEDAIPQTRQDVAELRKIAKNASDLRISIKKEHEAKIAETVSQLKEITDLYTSAANKLDEQVKVYEQKAQNEKEEQIRAYWNANVGNIGKYLSLQTAWNPRWLNKGYGMTQIQYEIDEAISKATNGVRTILAMKSPHEQTLLRTLFSTLDIQKVLDEKIVLDEQLERMQKDRDAQIASDSRQESVSAVEPVVVPEEEKNVIADDFEQYTIAFKVTGTKKQILALREFLISNSIKFVKGE